MVNPIKIVAWLMLSYMLYTRYMPRIRWLIELDWYVWTPRCIALLVVLHLTGFMSKFKNWFWIKFCFKWPATRQWAWDMQTEMTFHTTKIGV